MNNGSGNVIETLKASYAEWGGGGGELGRLFSPMRRDVTKKRNAQLPLLPFLNANFYSWLSWIPKLLLYFDSPYGLAKIRRD